MKKYGLLTLLAVSAFVFPALSHAGSVVVYDEPMDGADQLDQVSAKFSFNSENPEAGWAWVDVTTSAKFPEGHTQLSSYTHERRVPGLRYDAQAKQIVYEPSSGPKVVCANVSESGFLFIIKKKTELTGNCTLRSMIERRPASETDHGLGHTYGKVVMEIST